MLPQAFLGAAGCIGGFAKNCWEPRSVVVPPEPQAGDARFVTKGSEGPWDGAKISLVNATDFEWWYFDARSPDGDQGVAAWFMTANPASWGLELPTTSWFIFHARFQDGTGYDAVVPAESAVINEQGEGASGLWVGTGSGFTGAEDLSRFTLTFDVPDKDIHGVVDLTSTSRPRSAIRPATDSEADLMNVAGMGWAVSMPAGRSVAHVTVGDKAISFTNGGGYHDHNWGNSLPAWLNWYAIEGEFGPFVFSAIEAYKGPDGYFTYAWLSLHGKVILASLEDGCVSIRPWGNGAEYPPKGFQPQPLGFTLTFDAGEEGGKYRLNFTNHGDSPSLPIAKGLAKWFGTVEGGKIGGEQYSGGGMSEWLDLAI